jgi:hypothetical protein
VICRKQFLRAGFAAAAGLLLSGHTPYQQWVVYRRKHLLIGCHKDDPRTYDLAKQTVAALTEHLPAAKARVARAPHAGRLASLLGTGQMDVAILDAANAAAMSKGTGAFAPYGQTALRLLAPVNDRILVAQADFPLRHAWLLTSALAGSDLETAHDFAADVAWHPGSADFLQGRPEPRNE